MTPRLLCKSRHLSHLTPKRGDTQTGRITVRRLSTSPVITKPSILSAVAALTLSLSLAGCVIPYPHLFSNTVQASGRVIDARTKRPIEGAVVWIRGYPRTKTLTNQGGSFTIRPDESFHLFLDMPGDKFFEHLVVEQPKYATTEKQFIPITGEGSRPMVTLREPIQLIPR